MQATFVISDFLATTFKNNKKKQVKLILIIHFIYLNISKMLSFQPAGNIKKLLVRCFTFFFSH